MPTRARLSDLDRLIEAALTPAPRPADRSGKPTSDDPAEPPADDGAELIAALDAIQTSHAADYLRSGAHK
jgi:hypothetical protein